MWTAPHLPDTSPGEPGGYTAPRQRSYRIPGRVHSREFKLTVCRQIQSGEKRPAQICREHSLSESVLHRWRREFQERGESAFAPSLPAQCSPTRALEQQIADLERHCGQLSLENSLLKKQVERLQSRSAAP